MDLMAKPLVALLTDFRHTRSLRRRDEGRRPRHQSRRDAGRSVARSAAARHRLCGARSWRRSASTFPAGTIFLVVVDPGVGTARLGIAAEAGDWRFVAPDNGVLTGVFEEHPPKKVVELTERRYARPTVSRTFEGRDRFAPAAAWLSKGVQLARARTSRLRLRHAARCRSRSRATAC